MREPLKVMLFSTSNIGFGFVGVGVGVSSSRPGVGVGVGVSPPSSHTEGDGEARTLGPGVGDGYLLLTSSEPLRVTIQAIKIPETPMTKTIARIHGNMLRLGLCSALASLR